MARGVAHVELRAEATRLRIEKRMSLNEIEAATGVAKSNLSVWLREHPLTAEEVRARRVDPPKKGRGAESALHVAVRGRTLTRQQKGRIAEAAVLLRLVLHGFSPMSSPFDGDRVDYLVEVPESRRILKLQVKWASSAHPNGLPVVPLRCTDGHNRARRLARDEFDFVVGYNLFTDTAHVWSFDDVVRNKRFVTVDAESAEAWHKLRS